MIKALRVVLIVYGAILLVMGLGGIIFPDQISGLFGIEEVTDDIIYLAVIVSAFSISIGIWLIIAGRDPLRNIWGQVCANQDRPVCGRRVVPYYPGLC